MDLLNRAVLVVTPAHPFLDWLRYMGPSCQVTFDELRESGTAYLIPPFECLEETWSAIPRSLTPARRLGPGGAAARGPQKKHICFRNIRPTPFLGGRIMSAEAILAICFVGGGLLLGYLFHRAATKKYLAVLEPLAAKYGGTVSASFLMLPTWSLDIGGATAKVSAVPGGSGSGSGGGRAAATSCWVQQPVPERLRGACYPKGAAEQIAKFAGALNVEFGDEAFDARFVVKANDENAMREFLDEDLRAQLMKCTKDVRLNLMPEGFSVGILAMTYERADLEWLVETALTVNKRLI